MRGRLPAANFKIAPYRTDFCVIALFCCCRSLLTDRRKKTRLSMRVQAKDSQADVLPKIKETFKFAEFRQVLNEVNDVFDEDTQRGTDLIIR